MGYNYLEDWSNLHSSLYTRIILIWHDAISEKKTSVDG